MLFRIVQGIVNLRDAAGVEKGIISNPLYVAGNSVLATYSAAITGLVPGASPTDVLSIIGSGSKKITVNKFNVSGTQTTAAVELLSMIKRSTVNTGGGTGSVVQSQNALTTASSTTAAVTVTATGAGNLLVVQTMNSDNRTVTGVSDGTNAFTQATGAAGNNAGGGIQVDTWYLLSSSSGKTTITVTFSGTSTTKSVFFWEVSGNGIAFEVANRQNSGTVGATDTGASITPTATAFIASTIGTAGTITASPAASNTSFPNGAIQSNSKSAAEWGFQPLGTYTPTWSDSGAGTFASTVAAFTATGSVVPLLTAVKHDSGDGAATATVQRYLTNPTLGTAVGTVRAIQALVSTSLGSPDKVAWTFPSEFGKGLVLNSASESLSLNLGGAAMAGATFAVDLEWTEQ